MPKTMPHKLILAAATFALSTIASGSPALADTALTVGKAAANADPIIPVNVGDKLGIFKKHGLDLKIVDFTGGSKMTQAMTAGAIDIGDGAGTEMALVAKGVPMVAVCESATTFPFLAVGVPADSPLKSLDDLKGKKIGISSSGSLTDWLSRELSRVKGWGPDGVTAVAIGNGASAIVSAMRDHLVDADIGETGLFLNMEEKKTGRLLAPVSDFEGAAASGTLYASRHLVETNPAAIRTFIVAWLETMDYIRGHREETAKIESEITGNPESVMLRDYDVTKSMYTKNCKFDKESLATLKRTFVDLKLLDHVPDMSTLYTEAYLPK
ncbi:MAG TPA: ABC transporter substrate-binding protein [Stellaceae bacterium]|nr:ABC transporter substrate-binding protein [Stellaceae bacterium]